MSVPSSTHNAGVLTRMMQSRLLRGVLSVGLLRGLSLPVTLATAILLARLLGTEDYGRYAFAISLATLLTLPVGQGITQLLTREIAQGMLQGRFGVHPGIMAWAWRRLWLYVVTLLGLSAAVWFLLQNGELVWVATICLAPLVAGYQIYGGAIRGHGAPVQSQIPEMVVRPLGVLLLVLGAWALTEVTLTNALMLHVVATGFGLWLSWALCRWISPVEATAATPERNDHAWNQSSLSFMMITATNFMTIEIGILVLGLLGQPEQVSGMRIAQSGAQIVMLSLVAVDVVTQSQIAVLVREGGGRPLWQTYVRAARLAFGAALTLSLILIIWREPLVRITFGEEFVTLASWPLVFLVTMGVIHAFGGASSTMLNMAGQERQTLRAQSIALAITVLGVAVLAPLFGAAGAACAIAVGMATKKAAEAVYIKKYFGVWLHALSPYGASH